eukprot:TRINITY_DN4535_c0_g1_i1.p1 TRINITY_DN4535_c0_g1~~TRINITY_DN4535_c0_g1_i1.p1  ORF type:complete len:873 (+),score=242.30 TRINITY_DN4535_c0_g1_i1:70-2688(+)
MVTDVSTLPAASAEQSQLVDRLGAGALAFGFGESAKKQKQVQIQEEEALAGGAAPRRRSFTVPDLSTRDSATEPMMSPRRVSELSNAFDPLSPELSRCLDELGHICDVLTMCSVAPAGEPEGVRGGPENPTAWALRVGGRPAASAIRRVGELASQKLSDLRKAITEQAVTLYCEFASRCKEDVPEYAMTPSTVPAVQARRTSALEPFEVAASEARAHYLSKYGLGSFMRQRTRRKSSRPDPSSPMSPSGFGEDSMNTGRVRSPPGSPKDEGRLMLRRPLTGRQERMTVEGQLGAGLYLALMAMVAGVECERASVWLAVTREERGEVRTVLSCAAAYPAPSPAHRDPRDVEIAPGQGVAGAVYQTGVALNVSNTRTTALWDADEARKAGYDVRALLCFPLWSLSLSGGGRRPIGVVQMLNKRPPATRFTVEDERAALHRADSLSQIVARFPAKAFMCKFSSASLDCIALFSRGAEARLSDLQSDAEALARSVGDELLQQVADTRYPQRIYRTGARPVHITAKETLTAESVITDGSNLSDLSQHISWMEQMWRVSLDENAAMKSECQWWQAKCAEAQARMRWLERQHERAVRAPDLERARAALKVLPQEPSDASGLITAGQKPEFSRVRAYGASESLPQSELVQQQERRWAAFLGAPFEDKETQTERGHRSSLGRRGTMAPLMASLLTGFSADSTRHRPGSTFAPAVQNTPSRYFTNFTAFSSSMCTTPGMRNTHSGAPSRVPSAPARREARTSPPRRQPPSSPPAADGVARDPIRKFVNQRAPGASLRVRKRPASTTSSHSLVPVPPKRPQTQGGPGSVAAAAAATVSLDPRDYTDTGPTPLVCPPLELPAPPALVRKLSPPPQREPLAAEVV